MNIDSAYYKYKQQNLLSVYHSVNGVLCNLYNVKAP